MATQIKHRRGSTQEHLSFTGAVAEVTVDTEDFSLNVHDGVTKGGHKAAKKEEVTSLLGELAQTNANLLALGDKQQSDDTAINILVETAQAGVDSNSTDTAANASELAAQGGRITTLEATVGSSRVAYQTKALMDADTGQPTDTLGEVWNDATTTNNGLYGYTVGGWVKSSYDLQTDLQSQIDDNTAIQYNDHKLYSPFERYNQNDLTSLSTIYTGSVSRGRVYRAIKSARLGGLFDGASPVKLKAVWNEAYNPNNYFRLILEQWDGASWVAAFDSGNIGMPTIPVQNSDLYLYEATKSGYDVKIEIDLSILPVGFSGMLNSAEPELVFSKASFVESSSVEFNTVSFDNDITNTVWARYTEDINTTLNSEYAPGYKRHLLYQAVKNLKMYGFDSTKPVMLSHIWTNAYQPAQNLYRLIFKQWDGVTWNTVFDVQGQKDDLGVVDGRIFTWDKTVGGKRIICDVDYTNIFVEGGSNSPTLNTAEPDLIVAPNCFMKSTDADVLTTEQRLLQHNGSKEYVLSRRKPTFAFVWDDLNATDADVQAIFEEYGYQATYALKTNALNAATAPFYQEVYLKGATILAHSIDHPNMANPANTTYAEVDRQMTVSKAEIESYGMRVSGWVTPQSTLDASFADLAAKNFGYAFTGLNAGVYNHTVDPIKMNRYGLESAMSQAGGGIAVVKARIDTAIANDELLVFYGHQLPSTYKNPDDTSYMSTADFREVLDYIKLKADDNLCQVFGCDEAVAQYYKMPIIS